VQLFESLVFRDLSIYAQAIDARVFAYQDATGEFDAVVVRSDQWLGIEVKLSGRPEIIDAAAAGLVRLASRMRTSPTALVVITTGGPAYRRKDGVFVTSILDLGP
jgi:predicted house-cleaning NTP pyrophosphatase (Maf/HAM1 superfamily)